MYIIVLSKNPNSRLLYCVRMNSAVYCMVHNGMHIIGNHKIFLIIVTITHLYMCSKKALEKCLAQGFTSYKAQTNNKIIRDKSMQPPIPMWYKCKNINMVAMLTRDALLHHCRKQMYDGRIGGCALLSLMYSCKCIKTYCLYALHSFHNPPDNSVMGYKQLTQYNILYISTMHISEMHIAIHSRARDCLSVSVPDMLCL